MAELRSHREAAEEALTEAEQWTVAIEETSMEAAVRLATAQTHAILAVAHAILAAFTEVNEIRHVPPRSVTLDVSKYYTPPEGTE